MNPVGHGKKDNVHFTSRGQGYKFRIVGFFESGEAWILKSSKVKECESLNHVRLYAAIKDSLEEMDFYLKTPIKKFKSISIGSTDQLMKSDSYKSLKR